MQLLHEQAVLKHTFTYVGRKQRELITQQSVSQNVRAEKSDSEYKGVNRMCKNTFLS